VAPERIALWRILCATREEAADVLGAAKADLTPKNFAALAREHSRDKASYLKAGDLGLLAPDGSSAEPGLRVDPSIVRAAEGVRDGELVPLPVAEGDSFSVVWRRGTVAGVHKSLEQAAGQIRDGLLTQRLKDETDKLLIALRAAKVRSLDPSPLESIEREDETQRDASPVRP
jgi:peptidyl-prolyl cis-trans isomerase C